MNGETEVFVPLAQPSEWEGYGSEGDRILMRPTPGSRCAGPCEQEDDFPQQMRQNATIEMLDNIADSLGTNMLSLELTRQQMADPTRFALGSNVREDLGSRVHDAFEHMQKAKKLICDLRQELAKRSLRANGILQEIARTQKRQCPNCAEELSAACHLLRLRCGHVTHFKCATKQQSYHYLPHNMDCAQCNSPEPHSLVGLRAAGVQQGVPSAEVASLMLESDIELDRAYEGIPTPSSDPIEEVEFSQRPRKRRRQLVFN